MPYSRLRLALITVILSVCCQTLQAQQLQATRSHYSTDDGLCSNAISYISRDDLGYLWLATWNGLSRFDGYNFYNYQTGAGSHIPNLHNRILTISIDSQQNVWMQMYDGRVFVLKRSIDRIINPFEGISGNEEFRTSCPVMVASNGDVLVSIDGMGIYRMRPERDGFSMQLITTSGLVITSMAEGYQGDIWLGTDRGIHLMDPSNLTVERRGQFLEEHITHIFSNGYNIYGGTKSGKIVTFAYGTSPTVVRNGDQPITALYVDNQGIIWFSDNREGVYRLNPKTGDEKLFTQRLKVPDYDGRGGVFHEASGVLWIRLNHGGYGYYNRDADEIEYFHNNPENPWNLSNTVNAAMELDEGVIFESTSRRGLEKLEIMKNTIVRHLLVPDAESTLQNETRALLYDNDRHQLLIGNKANTIFIYDDRGNLVNTVSHDNEGHPIGRCYGLSKDSKGNYWLASKGEGLFRLTPAGGSYSITNMRHDGNDLNSLNSDNTYASVEDAQGNIWVATYGGGVNVLTRNKDGKTVFLHPGNGMNGYPYNSFLKVRTVALAKDGTVWAGSTDGILMMSCQNGQVTIERLTASEEYPDSILLSNDIVCLGVDADGSMWVGTNGGGIAHTTGQDSKGNWLFRNYGTADGLPGEEIKSLTFDSRGNVWFATDNTICSFDRDKHIFTTFSTLDGVDDTMCSECAAITLANDNILFGTINGYYVVDRRKLINSVGSALKLRITDFWLNGELQSPRLNNTFDYYVPESRSVELKSHNAVIRLRFASLNYQLQHRVHFQYMMEGYDKDWRNADKNRTVSYPKLPTGTYNFKVKAFLLESPERADFRELQIVVPPYWLLSSKAVWLYMALAAIICIRLMFWRQRKIRSKLIPDDVVEKKPGLMELLRQRMKKKKSTEKEETDEYEMMD